MRRLELYQADSPGYHPLLIRKGWQVAILNSDQAQHYSAITHIDVHFKTDEAFVLLEGAVHLITAEIEENQCRFFVEKMQYGVVYNVPKNTWHNISMEKGSKVIIVENDNTHIDDFDFHHFTEEDKLALAAAVESAEQLI